MASWSGTMIRHLELSTSIRHHSFGAGTYATTVIIGRAALDQILVELFLLREGLIDRLVITHKGTKLSVSSADTSKFGTYLQMAGGPTVSLTSVELEFISSFLLKYYRDGVAEVDHIDVDLGSGTLIVKAEDSKAPMSGVEAKRLLGLE
jgi:hypothetical protein